MAFAVALEGFLAPEPAWLVRLMAMIPTGGEPKAPARNGHATLPVESADGTEQDSDQVLVARAIGGDSRAFERLIRRHYDLIHRVAWRQTGLAQEAEDVTQNVLMQLVEKLGSWRGEARFTTWLVGITINACRDHGRRKSSFGRMREAFSTFAALGGEASDGRDLLRQSWLKSLLAKLPSDLRATVVLVAGEGLSHKEAAAELGIAENTVAWRMHQVRKQLSAESGRSAATTQKEIRDER